MAESRHRGTTRPSRRLSAARSILPTLGVMSIVVAAAAVMTDEEAPAEHAPQPDLIAVAQQQGQTTVSRSAERPPLPNEGAAEDKVEGHRFAAHETKVHTAAEEDSPVLATLERGDKVDITGVVDGDWAQIMHKGLPRWVAAAGLVKVMPLGTAPCASGSAVERGLRPDTIKVHRAVCAAFPSIARYGGVSGGGEHRTGQALDIMVSSDLGSQIAAFLQKNRSKLGIEYIIWRQRIWRPATSPSWRAMDDRGSRTANHMDHVHVTTYGNAAR